MAFATLSPVDYILLLLLLLLSTVIGMIFGFTKSKKSSAREYLLANGEMGVIPTALSLTVSFLSAISVLGLPSEIYMHGTMFLYQIGAWVIGLTLSALVFMPKFRELQFTSVFEYLEKRFDRTVRLCVSFLFTLYTLICMALVLYAPALALNQTTGLNIWLSVISIGVICTFYSSIGGIRAIIWTDVLQFTFILAGLLPAVVQGLVRLGGLRQTFFIASRGGRIELDNVNFDPRTRHTVWTLIIGCSFNVIAQYSFNQALVQRYLCVRSLRAARQVILINGVGIVTFLLLLSLTGLVIYAFYANCDPYTAGLVTSSDQLFPYFVMELLGSKRGLPGIFLACIFSASLSTISSGLNSLAAVFIEDVYQGWMRRELNDEQLGRASKIYSAILGAVVILLTFAISHLGSVLSAALSLEGVFAGPIMGVFFLGFFFPRVNRRSALIGLLVGLVLQLWIFVGAQMTKNRGQSSHLLLSVVNCSTLDRRTLSVTNINNTGYTNEFNPLLQLYSVSYLWYMPIAVFTVILVGLIVNSLTCAHQSPEVHPKLIIRMSDVIRSCSSKQQKESVGLEHNDQRNRRIDTKNTGMDLLEGPSSNEALL